MYTTGRNEKGSSIVMALAVLVVVGLVGVLGYMVYDGKHEAMPAAVPTSTSAPETARAKGSSAAGYLTIKEWGVKMVTPSPISNATYQIVTDNKNLHPSAFLSTTALDASAKCQEYYSPSYADKDNPTPSFQYIERLALTDTTSLDEGMTNITAEQAAEKAPGYYKKVGDHVYRYSHGNGFSCDEQSTDQTNAFKAAFDTMTETQ